MEVLRVLVAVGVLHLCLVVGSDQDNDSLLAFLHRNNEDPVTTERMLRKTGHVSPFQDPCYVDVAPPAGDDVPCGEGLCRCRHTVANCSFRTAKVSYVPKLPSSVTELFFTHNTLLSIDRDDFFQNVTDIEFLDLSFNYLTYVSPGAFRHLKKLKTLILIAHYMTYDTLAPVLSITTLTFLDISYSVTGRLGTPPDDLFHRYPLVHLETICLRYVGISHLNMAVFRPLGRLRNVQLTGNLLNDETLHTDFLPQLTGSIVLTENSFTQFLETCRGGVSLLPNLTWLDLSTNPLKALLKNHWMSSFAYTSICLPGLKYLSLWDTYLTEVEKDTFSQKAFPSLEILSLRGNNMLTMAGQFAFQNPSLQAFSLQSCGIDFAADIVHAECFAGCPNMVAIFLQNNDFRDVTEDKFNRLFRQVTRLGVLSLTSTRIGDIKAGMFTNFTSLQVLRLNVNRLTEIPDGVFSTGTASECK
ncbi:hypothetical protein BaRGS_00035219 [Batillaria attramentaria]|uniref:Uncharacterized protein n=1 Tax=Batillaria attramentaria TaxID=370345 RepID=A0ABD0JF34_9CAEN